MARIRLLQPYDGHKVGEVLDRGGGVASVLIQRRIAELDRPRPEGEVPAPDSEAPSVAKSAAVKKPTKPRTR